MRFARHARIFHGPLDPAPVAAMLMLLMLFMLLGSLVYTPGVLVELGPAATPITVTSSNVIAFNGQTYNPTDLDELRTDIQTMPGDAALSVKVESGANPNLARQVSNIFLINLPEGRDLTGTDHETVEVAVNFRGQCFYENRLVQESELKAELARRLKMAARDSKKLTLLLRMDKAAEYQIWTHLSELAHEVGITEILLAALAAHVQRVAMNSVLQECPTWTRGRFLVAVAVLFFLQVGLILLFGSRSKSLPPLSATAFRFRAVGTSVSEEDLLRRFFVGDPTVFPLPNPRGFSGRGWLNQRPMVPPSEIQLEPPMLLELSVTPLASNEPAGPFAFSRFVADRVARLGTNFLALPSGANPLFSSLPEQPTHIEEPLPVFLASEVIPTQSVFRLKGGLSDRLLGGLPILRSWPSDKLLTNSVVQIAVDPLGEVVVTRLETSCGLADADADAVAKASVLRFRPSTPSGTRWGEAVFAWQTSEPAGAVPAK